MCMNTVVVALPWASTVSFIFLIFCPSCWKVAVWLLGVVLGMSFDFSRLSFHVPISGLLCAKLVWGNTQATRLKSAMVINVVRRFMMFLPVIAYSKTF